YVSHGATVRALSWRAGPSTALEAPPLPAAGRDPGSGRLGEAPPLLEADGIRVVVERFVLIAPQHRHIHHFFQHVVPPFSVLVPFVSPGRRTGRAYGDTSVKSGD